MHHTKTGWLNAVAVVLSVVTSLTAVVFQSGAVSAQTNVPRSEVTISLYASFLAPRGWSTSPGAEAEPGPTIIVDVGDNVTLSLTSEDGLPHAFWVDYDAGSGAFPDIDPDEPHSTMFSTTNISYTFMARREGQFTYYCDLHYPAMFGTFVVRSPPVIVLRDPILGTSLTGGAPQVIDFDVLDASPLDKITLWLNYSYNGGQNRGTIAGPIQAGPDPNHVPWTPPRIDAPDAVMNITAIDPDGMVGYQTSTFQIDSTPPTVLSTFPGRGATDVSVAGIHVVWSEYMDEFTTFSPAAFGLRRTQDGAWVPGQFGYFYGTTGPGTGFTFVPDKPLARLTEYEALVNATANDRSRPGNPAIPTSWRFTTANDTTPPVITNVSVIPTRVSPNQSVWFTVTASDDRAMFRVFVHVVGPNTDANFSLSEEAGRWEFGEHFETPGTYNFTIWAADAGGNYASRQGIFEVVTPSTSEPFTVVALGILGAAIVATGLFWMIRRRRRSRGPPM